MLPNRSSIPSIRRVPSGCRARPGSLVAATLMTVVEPKVAFAAPLPVIVVRLTRPVLNAFAEITDARAGLGSEFVTPCRMAPIWRPDCSFIVRFATEGVLKSRSALGIDVIVQVTDVEKKLSVPTYTPVASTPRVGKSANPVVATYEVAFHVPVGSLVSDRPMRTELLLPGVLISAANQRPLSGSKNIRGSLKPRFVIAVEMPALVQNVVSVFDWTRTPFALL